MNDANRREANVSYTLDCFRGPDLVIQSGRRLGDGRLAIRGKMNWSKTKRMLEYAIACAERGNFMSINILVQPESLRLTKEEEENEEKD